MRYEYRRIEHPDDLRPGERLVQLQLPNMNRVYQGGRRLSPEYLTVLGAERAVPFQSRFKSERYR